jgi:type II secretion system protein I
MTPTSRAGISRAEAAFTLMEVVAALAIVSIALLALLRLHLLSVKTADQGQILTHAVLLAQEKMAEGVAGGYPQVGTRAGEVDSGGARLLWKTEVADARSSAPPQLDLKLGGLRKLSVEVAWEKGSGEKQIRMTTLVA